MNTRYLKKGKSYLSLFFILMAAFLVMPSAPAAAHMAKKIKALRMSSAKETRLIARGKKLFYSKNTGTNGFSCATCHVYSAGTYIKIHGKGMVIMPVKNAAKKMMMFNKIHHTHMTVGKKVAMCTRMSLRGHISKNKLAALTAYVNSLK